MATQAAFVIGDRTLTMHDATPRFPWSGNGLLSSPTAYSTIPMSSKTLLRIDQG
jgi:hypothetical protein